MTREEDSSGLCEEQEAAFLAPKIPPGKKKKKKCVQHYFLTTQSVRTVYKQEALSENNTTTTTAKWTLESVHPVPGPSSVEALPCNSPDETNHSGRRSGFESGLRHMSSVFLRKGQLLWVSFSSTREY